MKLWRIQTHLLVMLLLICFPSVNLYAREDAPEPSTTLPTAAPQRQWALAPQLLYMSGQARYAKADRVARGDLFLRMIFWIIPASGFIPVHVIDHNIIELQDHRHQPLRTESKSWKSDLHDWTVIVPDDPGQHDMLYSLHTSTKLPSHSIEKLGLLRVQATLLAGALPAEILTISPVDEYIDKEIAVENIPGMTLRITREPAKSMLQMYHVSVDFDHRLHLFQVRFLDDTGKDIPYPHSPYHQPDSLQFPHPVIKKYFRLPPQGCKTVQIHLFPKLHEVAVTGLCRNLRLHPYDPLDDEPGVPVELTPLENQND